MLHAHGLKMFAQGGLLMKLGRLGMKKGGLPLLPAFQYLILMT